MKHPLPDKPLFSVIIPSYNMAQYTRQTVESVLAQTYPHVEAIVVDDGSQDDTLKVLRPLSHKMTLVQQANCGACSARNNGFSRSRGELVAFLDCDDLWEPIKAEKVLECFKAHPQAGMVYSHGRWIDAQGRVIGPRGFPKLPSGRIFDSLIQQDYILNSTPVMRREALEEVGLWDEKIFTTADWDLWLRIAKRFEVVFIPEVLSRTRVASYYNARNIDQTRRETLYLIEKHRSDITPDQERICRANMHFYLSRLYAANGDLAAARREASFAKRLKPDRMKFRLSAGLYGLGRPANAFFEGLLKTVTALRGRWI